jgi:hypothetical protein
MVVSGTFHFEISNYFIDCGSTVSAQLSKYTSQSTWLAHLGHQLKLLAKEICKFYLGNVLSFDVLLHVLEKIGLKQVKFLSQLFSDELRQRSFVLSEIETSSLIEIVHEFDKHEIDSVTVSFGYEG